MVESTIVPSEGPSYSQDLTDGPSLCLDSSSDEETLHSGRTHPISGPRALLQSFSLDVTATAQRLQLGLVIRADATACQSSALSFPLTPDLI